MTPQTITRWQPQIVRESMSRPSKSVPSQKKTSFFSVNGVANGATGLFGSISGRKGAVTAISSQKNTSVTPIIATVDSRQARTPTT